MIKLIISFNVLLSWIEKDDKGMSSFCVAFSADKGKTFSEKKVIYSGTDNATNSTGLIVGNQLLIAHEVKQDNKKNSLKIATTAL